LLCNTTVMIERHSRGSVSGAMSFPMQFPSRSLLVPIIFFACGVVSVLGYGYITRDNVVESARPTPSVTYRAQAPAARVGAEQHAGSDPVLASEPSTADDKSPSAVTPDAVSTWIAQATGTDAAKRATAIAALADASKDDAIPVLAQVLETADETDGPLVLRSLQTLAQRQGDSDDRIRSVVRKTVFHAADDATIQVAQATLEAIEHDLSQTGSASRR
jgi:hypothetical protein